ncbi:unnamed protein product [Lactuca saligna]|uniref:Uncharacterized protein n=1 Tax=Lactuca saligna TaxID=75948 RepID=A0AA35Z936_LACSI|nr:unnamed protein product [Lactuca saligna]
MKSLGPHTVGLIKQNRRGKVVFQGLHPFEKFGKFTELDEPTESYGLSEQTSSEPASAEKSSPNNVVIDISEDEGTEKEDTPTPDTQIASEHEKELGHIQDDVEMNVDMGENVGEDRNDSFSDLDLTSFDHDDIVASLSSSANVVSHENLDTIFNNVDDVVTPTTETRKSSETFETKTPTSGQMVTASIPMEIVIGCSPPVSVSPTTEPFASVFTPEYDQHPSKRQRRDVRQSEPVASLISDLPTPPVTAATTRLTTTKMFPIGSSSSFNVGGPSVPPDFTIPRYNRDDASERLALHMAEEQLLTPNPRGKGVSIEEGGSRGDNLTLSGLQKEISALSQKNIEFDIQVTKLRAKNSKLSIKVSELQSDKSSLGVKMAELTKDKRLKSKQISDLQDHFNLITSSYFELNKKLEEDRGDKYQTFVEERRINLHVQAFPVDLPVGQSSGTASREDDAPPLAPHVTETIHRDQDEEVKKGKLLP